MTLARHVVVFARAPRVGQGKRRLARDLGDVAAWRFQRLRTAHLLRSLGADPRWMLWLAITPDAAAARRSGPGRVPVRVLPQGPGDLGARMGRVMHRLPPGPAVIVGADVPDVRRRHIARAFARLGRHDAVIGPADDGGYWLIGLKRRPAVRTPFAGVRWGGPHARADTEANLRRLGMSLAWLETLRDVDTAADLRAGDWR